MANRRQEPQINISVHGNTGWLLRLSNRNTLDRSDQGPNGRLPENYVEPITS